jgi:hypothetical protein
MRTLALAAACLAMVQPAIAARLASPPMSSIGQATRYDCSIEYLGTSTAPIRVLITARLAGETKWQVRKSIRSGFGNTAATAVAVCTSPDGSGCGPLTCIFSFGAPAADFRASACTKIDAVEAVPSCVPAH